MARSGASHQIGKNPVGMMPPDGSRCTTWVDVTPEAFVTKGGVHADTP
jgi:hypothetical protein